MEKLKKERFKGPSRNKNKVACAVSGKCNGRSNGGMSEGEEGYVFCVPLTKRIKLQDKVSDDFKPVDPAIVPRKLRSAISKRICQSVSPPLSESKRKHLHDLKQSQRSKSYIAERCRQNMLDQVTEDEEEVAEALTMLATPTSARKPNKNKVDTVTVEENSESKGASTHFPEASKENPKLILPCNGSISTNPFPCAEESRKYNMKAEPSGLEQQIAASVSHNTTPSPTNGMKGNAASSEDAMNSCNPLKLCGPSMHGYGVGIGQLGSMLIEHNLQTVEQKTDNGTTTHSQREITLDMRNGLSGSVHGHLTTSSSKAKGHVRTVTTSAKCSSSRNEPPMLSSVDGKAPHKKCLTHVYISHLIRNHQNTKERQQQPSSPPVKQTMAKEGSESSSHSTNGTALLTKIPQSNGSQGNIQMLNEQTQPVSSLSGAYAQNQQAVELVSISAEDTKLSGNGLKSSEQFHIPYPPRHSTMPFPFQQGPYLPQYQDQLAAAAFHQGQLQLLFGDAGSYGNSRTKQQQHQQQLMWHVQTGNYSPPLGIPRKWQQNGLHPDSFPTLPMLPLPKDYHPVNSQSHFLLPVPTSSSLLQRAQQQQHNSVPLNLGTTFR